MPVDRNIITDFYWAKIAPLCLGKTSAPARTGVHWRDLSGEFGKWNSVYRWFRDWARAGAF